MSILNARVREVGKRGMVYRVIHTRKTGLFVWPLIIYVAVFFIYPLYYSIHTSVTNLNVYTLLGQGLHFVGLANYHAAMAGIWRPLLNTLQFTIASIILQFVIGLLLAWLFSNMFPLNRFLRSVLIIPWLLPAIVSGTLFRWIFSTTNGAINGLLLSMHLITQPIQWLLHPELAMWVIIVTNVWIGIPFNLILLHGGMQDIPKDIYEAAQIDGSSGWKTFTKITIPNLRGVISITLMMGLIYTLKTFDIVMALTQGGPANSTQLLSSWSYTVFYTTMNFGQGAALSNILLIISLVFAVGYLWFYRRQNQN